MTKTNKNKPFDFGDILKMSKAKSKKEVIQILSTNGTKPVENWEKEFDYKFEDRLYSEERNVDWIKKRQDKWIWVNKSNEVKLFISSILSQQAGHFVEMGEGMKRTKDRFVMNGHALGYNDCISDYQDLIKTTIEKKEGKDE